MARYQGSIFGTILGIVQNDTVASTWKGIKYVKKRAVSYNDANTLMQQKLRTRFTALSALSKMFATATKTGFKKQANGMTQGNVFTSRNANTVTVSDQLDVAINYNDVQISDGSLEKSGNTLMASKSGTTVTIVWDDGTNPERENDDVYCYARISEIADLLEEITHVKRSAKESSIILPVATTNAMTVYFFMRDPVTGICSQSETVAIPA